MSKKLMHSTHGSCGQFLLKEINLSRFFILSQHLQSAIKIPTMEKNPFYFDLGCWDVRILFHRGSNSWKLVLFYALPCQGTIVTIPST
jgi:hypothetical protein